MTKQLTTQQYADLIGVCAGAIRKAIHEKRKLEGVVSRTTFGNAHVFNVSKSFIKKMNKN